jgi:hypothetical protein
VNVDGAPVTPDDKVYYFVEAPPVFFGHTPFQVAATLLMPAAAAALGYGLCAAWTTRDDLGGYPADESAGLQTLTSGEQTPAAASPQVPGVTTDGQ